MLHASRKIGFTLEHAMNRGNQFFSGVDLEHIAEDAGIERAADEFGLAVGSEEDDGRAKTAVQDFATGIDAIDEGHADVGDDNVGLEALGGLDEFESVSNGRNDFKMAVEYGPDLFEQSGVVVGQHQPQTGSGCRLFTSLHAVLKHSIDDGG